MMACWGIFSISALLSSIDKGMDFSNHGSHGSDVAAHLVKILVLWSERAGCMKMSFIPTVKTQVCFQGERGQPQSYPPGALTKSIAHCIRKSLHFSREPSYLSGSVRGTRWNHIWGYGRGYITHF